MKVVSIHFLFSTFKLIQNKGQILFFLANKVTCIASKHHVTLSFSVYNTTENNTTRETNQRSYGSYIRNSYSYCLYLFALLLLFYFQLYPKSKQSHRVCALRKEPRFQPYNIIKSATYQLTTGYNSHQMKGKNKVVMHFLNLQLSFFLAFFF